MEYLREFKCELTGSIVVICKNDAGVEVAMSLEFYCSNYYSPINPDSKEELTKQVSQRMARYNESERVALGSMIENAKWSMEVAMGYDQDIEWSETNAERETLIGMLKALPPVKYVKNSLGNMFPELMKLKAS